MHDTIRGLMAALSNAETLPAVALRALVEQADAATPALLEALQGVLRDPEGFVGDSIDGPADKAPFFAAYILGYLQESKAHRPLIRVLSHPSSLGYDIFGDNLLMHMGALLWNTCGGDHSAILALAKGAQGDPFCRWAAVDALVLGVGDGALARDTISTLFVELLKNIDPELNEPVADALLGGLTAMWSPHTRDHLLDESAPAFKPFAINPPNPPATDDAALERLRVTTRQKLAQEPWDTLERWAPLQFSAFADEGRREPAKPKRSLARKEGAKRRCRSTRKRR